MLTPLRAALASAGWIVAAMAALSIVEAVAPLRERGRAGRAHVVPNLVLTGLAFAASAALQSVLLGALAVLEAKQFGLLRAAGLGPVPSTAAAVVALDFAWYATHVAMHRLPALWRFHCVHHADPMVDATTTVRQHPGESVVRYAVLAAFALPLGVSPAAFAVYRLASALHGLFEHANVRMPLRLDALLSVVVTTPLTHKVHHSRRREETDSNFGNVFSVYDRLLGTFAPSRRGLRVDYGLDGFDAPATQTTAALLALPLRRARAVATLGASAVTTP